MAILKSAVVLGNANINGSTRILRDLTLDGGIISSLNASSTKLWNTNGGITDLSATLAGYLPLVGGTMTGTITRDYTTASNDPMLSLASSNQDTWLWRISSSTHVTSSGYGYGLKYIGTGSDVNNRLRLYADNQTGTQVIAASFNQSGQVGIGTDSDTNYRVKVNGNSNFQYNTTSASQPILTLTNTSYNGTGYAYGENMLFPALVSGSKISNIFGKSLSDRNAGSYGYRHVGDGSTSNYVAIGLYNIIDILNVTGGRKVGINTTSPSESLTVKGGNIKIETSASTAGCVMSYDSTEECMKFSFS